MLFSKANQVMDFQWLAVIQQYTPVISSKHLVNFAKDHPQVGLRGAIFEGCEGQLQSALVIREMPGLHIVAGTVIKAHGSKLVDAPIQDGAVLSRLAQVAKTLAQVQPKRAAIW